VPLTVRTGKNDRIDTFSIVPHAQSKLLIVIADFNFDLPGLGVLKRVPQRLKRQSCKFPHAGWVKFRASPSTVTRNAEVRCLAGAARQQNA
jgi:hypothetical protein